MDRSSAYAVCFCDTVVRVYSVAFKPLCQAALILDQAFKVNEAGLIEVTTQVVEKLKQDGYRQQPVVVGLDCFQSLAIPAPKADAVKSRKVGQLEVELEETCPVDAENMVAARLNPDLAIIAIRNRIEPALEVMRAQAINLVSVVPTSLLIARTLLHRKTLPADCRLLIDMGHVEAVVVKGSQIADWYFAQSNLGELDNNIQTLAIAADPEASTASDDAEQIGDPFESVLAHGVSLIVQDRFEPELVSFKSLSHQVSQSPLMGAMHAVGIAVAFMLMAVTIGNLWQARQYRQTAISLDSKVASLYTDLFPDAPKTRLVDRALTVKCEQLEKQSALLEKANSTDQILRSLYVVIDSVPGDYSIQVDTIRIAGQKIQLEGTAENLESVDRLKAEFESRGLVLIPNEQQYGISFKLSYLVSEDFDLSGGRDGV